MSSLQMEPGAIFAGRFHIQRVIHLHLSMESARYEVSDGKGGAVLCLKILSGDVVKDSTLRKRFIDHLKASAAVASPAVLPVLDAGVETGSGLLWYVTELLTGLDLEEVLKQGGALAKEEAVALLEQIGDGLAAAHRAGQVHGNLKPKNIFVCAPATDGPHVKLLNLGVNTALTEAKPASAAAQGTPMWMAPEQATAGELPRPEVDVWAYALLAFRLLTGRFYWREANKRPLSPIAVMREVSIAELESASVRAREYDPHLTLPADFDAWFAACVQRDSSRRYPTAEDASLAFREVLAGRPPPLPAPRAAVAVATVLDQPKDKGNKDNKDNGKAEPPTSAASLVSPADPGRERNAARRPMPPRTPSLQRRPLRLLLIFLLLLLTLPLLRMVGTGLWQRYQKQQQQRLCDAPATSREDLLQRFTACQDSCASGRAAHCLQAGHLILQHKILNEHSEQEAAHAYEQACQLQLFSGCRQLAMMFWEGNQGLGKDRDRSIALLLQACAGEDAEACAQLTEVELSQIKLPQDQERLVNLLERSCQKNEVASCAQLGRLYVLRKDLGRAFERFERACAQKDAASCAEAGQLALGEVGRPRDVGQAVQLFRRACDKELSIGCYWLGQLYARGEGTARDLPGASKIYQQDCARGGADSCHALAMLHLNGHGVERDRRQGMELLKRACELGHRASCEAEAPAVKPEHTIAKDKERPASDAPAQHVLEACQAGSGESCYRVAVMLERGQGLPKDRQRARNFYILACRKEVLEGCQDARRLQEEAPLPELGPNVFCRLEAGCANEDQAGASVRTRTCGNAASCYNLGKMFRKGEDVPRDLARAAAAFRQSCELGHGTACVQLAQMYERGEGVPRDARRAVELYRKGCAIGAGSGCERFEPTKEALPQIIHL